MAASENEPSNTSDGDSRETPCNGAGDTTARNDSAIGNTAASETTASDAAAGEIATGDTAEANALAASRQRQLRYVMSLPERTLRSGTGLLAGALRESAALLVPQSFQNSQTYTVMIRQMLDFLAEDVGGVTRQESAAGSSETDQFVARKAVGNFLEMAALATLHVSPLTLLAVFSDVAYGSQTYLLELAAELKRQGVIDQDSRIQHASDLLAAVADASRTTASAFNTPPLSVEGLKQTIEETRAAVAQIRPEQVLSEDELRRLWQQLRDLAKRENVDLLTVSGAVTIGSLDTLGVLSRGALSSVRVTRALVDRHIVQHYTESIARIRDRGIYQALMQTSEPYLHAVWENFSTEKPTLTDSLLSGKLVGSAWSAVQRWLPRSTSASQATDGAGCQAAATHPATSETLEPEEPAAKEMNPQTPESTTSQLPEA